MGWRRIDRWSQHTAAGRQRNNSSFALTRNIHIYRNRRRPKENRGGHRVPALKAGFCGPGRPADTRTQDEATWTRAGLVCICVLERVSGNGCSGLAETTTSRTAPSISPVMGSRRAGRKDYTTQPSKLGWSLLRRADQTMLFPVGARAVTSKVSPLPWPATASHALHAR